MKNIYEPDNEDVLEWLGNPSDHNWPASDWDYYVMNGKNDELVLRFANDEVCSQKDFFVHCLYYLVGDSFNENNKNEEKRQRIDTLLNMVDSQSLGEVKKWKDATLKLFTGELAFYPQFWLHYMFRQNT